MMRHIFDICVRHYHQRKECRVWLPTYAWLFAVLVVGSPFVVMGDAIMAPPIPNVLGLHPELVKYVWNGLFIIASLLIIRALNRVVESLNSLHTNQRELAKVLTQLTTAHNINHGQNIQAPEMISGGETKIL